MIGHNGTFLEHENFSTTAATLLIKDISISVCLVCKLANIECTKI